MATLVEAAHKESLSPPMLIGLEGVSLLLLTEYVDAKGNSSTSDFNLPLVLVFIQTINFNNPEDISIVVSANYTEVLISMEPVNQKVSIL